MTTSLMTGGWICDVPPASILKLVVSDNLTAVVKDTKVKAVIRSDVKLTCTIKSLKKIALIGVCS